MGSIVQAIAVDYDGTLTDADRPSPDLLAALREVRREGRAVVLVTGRILSELRAAFPDVDDEFDAIVAENGAVLSDADGIHDLVDPVDPVLAQALAHRDVPVRQGRVLLACDATHAGPVGEEITRLGLDCQQVRNRAALMILPGGVTKGTGLVQALGNLGISRHSTLAIGDAENDHHLLAVCELGVAVANAVDSLKQHADLVLEHPNGEGVAALLRGPIVSGEQAPAPKRWQLALGVDHVGNEVRIPASGVNVLLFGASCSGKSYLAGLLVEQLARLHYSVLVLDREGDHRTLAERRGILVVGGSEPLPTPTQLAALIRHRFGTIVVDLSTHDDAAQRDYVASIAPTVLGQRAATGLPHWVFVDEAHALPVGEGLWADALASGAKGFCLSTYLPDALPAALRAEADHLVLSAGGGAREAEVLGFVSETVDMDRAQLGRLLGERIGDALLVDPTDRSEPRRFTVQRRGTGHLRHWHKFIDGEVPEHERFYFTGSDRVAKNLRAFHAELAACSDATLATHARKSDFSRWILAIFQDGDLSTTVATAEERYRTSEHDAAALREALRRAIETRYLS